VWAVRYGGCGGGIYRGRRPGSIDGAEEGRGREGYRWSCSFKDGGEKLTRSGEGDGWDGRGEPRERDRTQGMMVWDGTDKEGHTTGSGQSWRETSALGSRGPVSRFGLLRLDWLQ
jgi:hypothetical protein